MLDDLLPAGGVRGITVATSNQPCVDAWKAVTKVLRIQETGQSMVR